MAEAEAETSAAAASLPSIRLWRTAFLTLRDETLTSPPCQTLIQLLNQLIFSQAHALLAAAPDLPSHEITSDVMFLTELVCNTISDSRGGHVLFPIDSFIDCLTQFSHFIHGIRNRVSLKISPTSWALLLNSFREVIDILHGKGEVKHFSVGDVSRVRAIKQCLETIRYLFGVYQWSSMLSENKQLLDFLLCVLACSQEESVCSYSTCNNNKMSVNNGLCDIQAIAFTMIGDIYSRVGSSLPIDLWQSTIEVLRKVMDALASKGILVEDNNMARFYTSLLQCLHLVLMDPKGSLSGHVASLVATLRMFFHYGLMNTSRVAFPFGDYKKETGSFGTDLNRLDSKKSKSGPYRPPHLRRKESKDSRPDSENSLTSSENESSAVLHISSDSDYSDSDGSQRDGHVHYAKTRLAAIICIQDLCRADPKSFTAYWPMLLPSSDVLQPRKYEATLMSCLLFDSYTKARIACASTISAMLEGQASIFLQVAEYKESTKTGSFTALSSSLGQILMQLHSGVLHLITHETSGGLLASLFKILILLTSSTPYSRMPADLLATVISSVGARIEEGFPSQSDNTSLMAAAINCLTIALSASPSSDHIKDMLLVEISKGSRKAQLKSGVLSTLIRCSEPMTNSSICLEALKALKAVAHNYPSTILSCWEQISSLIYGFFGSPPEPQAMSWRVNVGNAGGPIGERVITAAVKVLDECLRAISGFKGTEDLSDEKLLDDPFTSDCVKTKSISSAPYYGPERPSQTADEPNAPPAGREQWSEAISKHIRLGLQHSSAMVRAASVTCFAGITSSVFSSLPKEEQDAILNSSIKAALRDDVPSVRSAACRALGIIACFPQLLQSVKILDQFICAAEHNTRDSQISVRIAASWALANICDSLRHCITADTFKKDIKASSQLISLLIDSALRLAEDNDKIKANAVRALGNLARFVPYTSESFLNDKEVDCILLPLACSGTNNASTSDKLGQSSNSVKQAFAKDLMCLEKMVQVFLSCVSTGNVKVQWNVCHALSNLFCNKTLELQDANWASSVFSILLLLLRDSSNFKIRIQAAAALAVPVTVNDYGRSFYDVLKGVEHIVENSSSDLVSSPSNFKYKVALEKQLTSTLLHLIGLASRTDNRAVQEFLVRKSSFLEEWLRELRLSLERSKQLEAEHDVLLNQKREVISRAVHSLVKVYETSNHHAIAQKFDTLAESIL